MSKINQIETAILALDAGAYQKLMDCYIVRKYKLPNITPLGSHSGTNKTTKGTPDSFSRCENGKYILIAYGTVGKNAYDKIESDILDCLNSEKTGIKEDDIEQIICCHTSTNLTAGQVKTLCSHFNNTILIGLGDISYDLNEKYPDIAKDHLGIDIDSHQIFSTEVFVSESDKNAYSTSLNMELLCRDDEVNELTKLMEQNQVLLLLGPSGVGKSRLALEAIKKYSIEKQCIARIIKSNGESIYQDLKVNFPDENDYVILVDDANQLTQLQHLLRMYIDKSRKHTIKLILTVRDYAKEQLLKSVREYVSPEEYIVKRLSDDAISKILEENFEIKNRELSEHICRIAKGNVRIAIMAGTCVTEGKLEKINNVFDIFNDYYSEIVTSLSKKQCLLAV